jgi:superfamily II DNA helicase RecQ
VSTNTCNNIQTEFELTGNKILDTLRQVFKHEKFRRKQQEAIESVINGHNTLLIMPTGCDKTVCYAVPAVMENKVAVVVFPLLALLLDQSERLRRKGMNVCYLMTDMEEEERENVIHKLNCNPPEYNFFFVTPETVLTPAVLILLQNISSKNLLGLVVIDEAHCIDTWGFHFRPSYAELWKLCHLGSPILAMTGTATTRTQSVILNSLQLSEKIMVSKQTPSCENLIYHIMEKKSNGVDAIAGIDAVFFHAGMNIHSRQASVDSWKSGEAHVICATVAFGIGIDKSNVRCVIYHSMPKDLDMSRSLAELEEIEILHIVTSCSDSKTEQNICGISVVYQRVIASMLD